MVNERPSGLRRLLFRLPVHLYRAGLGPLLGHRFVYLAHTGRISGERRDVVLEVVRWRPEVPEVAVVAAWGRRADWFRNLAAAPALEVRVGRHRWLRPDHEVLDEVEAVDLLGHYRHHHPRSWAALAPRLGLNLDTPDADIATAAQRFPAVVLRPR